jgi:hypothetical protein
MTIADADDNLSGAPRDPRPESSARSAIALRSRNDTPSGRAETNVEKAMMTTERFIVRRAPEEVFDYLTDRANLANWQTSKTVVEKLTDGPSNSGRACRSAQSHQVNAELTARFVASGQGLISSTRLDGRYALRLCVMNQTSPAEDVKRTIRWLAEIPVLHGASKPGHGQWARTAGNPAPPRLAPAFGADRGS